MEAILKLQTLNFNLRSIIILLKQEYILCNIETFKNKQSFLVYYCTTTVHGESSNGDGEFECSKDQEIKHIK